MQKKPGDPEKILHILVGTPNEDDCPVCRAHRALAADPAVSGPWGPVFVEVLPLRQILRCPCPLCEQARQGGIGG